MKKLLSILTLAAVGGALILGAKPSNKTESVQAAGPGYTTYVPVSDGWIENYANGTNDTARLLRGRNDTFWDTRTFNAMDEFVDSIHRADGGEAWRGAYRTQNLTLYDNNHRYISFLFGGGPDNIFMNVYQVSGAAGAGDRIDHVHTKFAAPERSCNMCFFYFELPSQIQPGDNFLLYVEDGRESDYGGFTFGSIHINQTLEDVAKTFSVHKAQLKLNEYYHEDNRSACESILNFYATDSFYATVRTAEAALTNANEDFEVNHHLSMWAFDYVNSTAPLDFNAAINGTDYKQDDYFQVGMPSNKTGDMYFRAENTGVAEDAKYRLISNEFTLSGSGFVSAKLGGGTAVLEVLDSNYSVIASSAVAAATGENKLRPGFKGEANQAETFNLAETGVRLNTMSRVYLDVSAHKDERVRIAISDGRTGNGWGLAYFDEIKTYYAETPSFKVDVAKQGDHYITIPDEYVGSDSTAFGKAHAFWRSYLSLLREGNTNYCTTRVSDDVKTLLSTYKSIGEDAQRIVCASQDYQRSGEGNWYDINPTIRNSNDQYSMSNSLSYLAEENGVVGVNVFGTNSQASALPALLSGKNTPIITVIVLISVIGLSLIALFAIKKRKHQ